MSFESIMKRLDAIEDYFCQQVRRELFITLSPFPDVIIDLIQEYHGFSERNIKK